MRKPRAVGNFWLGASRVAEWLGHEGPLPQEDWVVLKTGWWGEIAFDYREGIRFAIRPVEENLKSLVKLVRRYMEEANAWVSKEALERHKLKSLLQISLVHLPSDERGRFEEVLERHGWVQDGECAHAWWYPQEKLPQRRAWIAMGSTSQAEVQAVTEEWAEVFAQEDLGEDIISVELVEES